MTDTTGELLLYADDAGVTRLHVRLLDGTVWLSQRQLAALFSTTVQNVNQHLLAIYAEGELSSQATIKKYLIVQSEGTRQVSRQVDHYALPAVVALGYRVRSPVGTRFRQWATARLEEYVVKGFTIDDARLKSAGSDDYFDELLARIRDIRSSERVFWRKVLDIYATSVDYDPKLESSKRFFQTVQNKMHWAAHGHTAAEIVAARADAEKPNMGLRSWDAGAVRKADVGVAKNYLEHDEVEALNRTVNAYLEFAELQALGRRTMTMAAWIQKLDEYLSLADRDVLTHAGAVSADAARAHAEEHYARWRTEQAALPQAVDAAFDSAIREARTLEKARPRRTPKKADR